MNKNNLIELGLLEKEKNAIKLQLETLSKIGIDSIGELESILYDKKFSVKNRISNFAKLKDVSVSNAKSEELKAIPEEEKCQKLKAYEKLQKEIYDKSIDSTRSTDGIYVINRSGRTLYTTSGQPLYHKEVCVKFANSGKIYMMRTNGSMGYEYLNSTDSNDNNFRKFNDLHFQPYYHLAVRGTKVELFDYYGSYFGWIDYEDLVRNNGEYFAANSNHLLMSIRLYRVYGEWRDFNGFVHPKLNLATSMDKIAVYGNSNNL